MSVGNNLESIWEESLNEGLSKLAWALGLSVKGSLTLIDVERPCL